MNLFEIIPGNFFSVLSSKNKELYVDALMLLHKLFQYELNIETSDYLSALIGLLENRSYEAEDDDELTDGSLPLSAQARLIMNRFISTGWVDKEYMDGSFTEVITPRTYAIQVMQLLYDLGDNNAREYNSLVFSTYSALKEARDNQPGLMYEAVINAKSNTERLIRELKTLYHGIRGYLKKIQGQNDVNTLLRDHFDEYKALADRIYHPIKTMDSVYRYMTPIREILAGALGNPEIMENMRKRAVSIKRYDAEDDAGMEIADAINYVTDIYRSLGGIVTEIDKKHSNYTKLSVDTIRYHMSADQTIGGKLAEILKRYAAADEKTGERKKLMGLMENKIRVNRQEFIDGNSLWHRNVKSRRSTAEPLVVDGGARIPDDEADRIIKSMHGDFSLSRIMKYMNSLFKDKDILSTDEIDIPGDREFILLLLAAIRAGERNVNFSAQAGSGRVDINGYVVPLMRFAKKRGGG